MKATCRKTSCAVGVAAGDLGAAEGAAAGGVGEALDDRAAEALDEVGDVDAGRGAGAEQLAGGVVGVGERPVGLEPGQRHRQILEEMVRHEAGDLGHVERHQQHVAAAVGAGTTTRARGVAGAREDVHAVGAQRRDRPAVRSTEAKAPGESPSSASLERRTRPSASIRIQGTPASASPGGSPGALATRSTRHNRVQGPWRRTEMRFPGWPAASAATPLARASRVRR